MKTLLIMKTRIFFSLICLSISYTVFSQSTQLFSVDRELSSSLINHICQDHQGIIWICTEEGLNRYDGSKFTIYKHDPHNKNSLLDNYVRFMYEDNKNRLFLGLLKGLQIYDRDTDMFHEIPLLFQHGEIYRPHITSILQRRNGEILIATSGQGIYILQDTEEPYAIQNTNIIPSSLITWMFEDNEENLWIATEDNGVFRLTNDGKLKKFGFKEVGWNLVSVICQDKKGNLLAGSMTNGLFLYDKASDSFIPVPYQNKQNLPIKTLYVTDNDDIYIGTDGQGVKTVDLQHLQINDAVFNVNTFDLTKSKVHSILQDRTGNIWLGIFQKGVSVLPAGTNQFNYIGYKSVSMDIIGSNCIMSVFKDHQGVLWVGTDSDGLYGIYPDGKRSVHFKPTGHPSSPPSTIMCIYEDSNHDLWVGSYLNGLAKIDKHTGYCTYRGDLLDANGAPVQRIYSIIEDNERNLWIGTMGSGLFCINRDTNEITRYDSHYEDEYRTDINQLNHPYINQLLITRNGKLYIGTFDGLGCMDINTKDFLSTYKENRLLVGHVIYSLYEDKEGVIWLGTSNGLFYIDKYTQEFISYTTADGLPSNVICGIAEDRSGNLWLSTHYGISKMNPREKTFVNYYGNDGLQGNEFSKGASFVDDNGYIFFGGTHGVTWFDPSGITNPERRVEVRITDFYLHDKPVRKGMKSGRYHIINTSVLEAQNFQLDYKDNSFSIEFSTIDFNTPERIGYLYSVNNEKWTTLTPGNNRVTFSDLPPGKYNFKVMAEGYNITSGVKEIFISIAPAWYASAWAKLIYLFIACGIIYLVIQQIRHRYQARQEMLEHQHAKEINEAKLQFFINIAHEIRTPMSLIISPLKKLIDSDPDNERQHNYLTIHRNAERILSLINQLMDIRKIDKGQMSLKFRKVELVEFIRDLYAIFEYPASTKNIHFTFTHDPGTLYAWVDPANFDKIILNILSNAFKYTPQGGEINICLRSGEEENKENEIQQYFEIIISDTGIGVQEEEVERIFERFYQIRNSHNNPHISTGIGLHLTRSLVELHHGSIWVENNKEGKGCSFIIHLPLGKEHLRAEELEENPQPIVSKLPLVPKISGIPAENEQKKIKSKSKRRVMVVEDDEEIRQYISHELAPDYHIIECVNGKDAFDKILRKQPDLIISDVMMPEMDGVTLCRKIKQNVNTNHIPVVLVTAKSKEEDNLEGLSIGADAYIVKPFNIEILKKTVENIIRTREILKNNFTGSQQQEDKVKRITLKSADDKLMEKIMAIINENISNTDLNVEMIANQVGISRVHLHRKLKELTNQTTRDLIRNIRLKQAADLLASKNLNISEVADATGFSSLTAFSTAFKDLYGLSPKAWMETQRDQK